MADVGAGVASTALLSTFADAPELTELEVDQSSSASKPSNKMASVAVEKKTSADIGYLPKYPPITTGDKSIQISSNHALPNDGRSELLNEASTSAVSSTRPEAVVARLALRAAMDGMEMKDVVNVAVVKEVADMVKAAVEDSKLSSPVKTFAGEVRDPSFPHLV
jgi:hypothetical protein